MKTYKVLVFGTAYAKNVDDARDVAEWARQTCGCMTMPADMRIIDSNSPQRDALIAIAAHTVNCMYESFMDNIGHLAKHGQDGWGRAFCEGVRIAVDHNYDFAVHVETDMLMRVDIGDVVRLMIDKGIDFLAPKNQYELLETGLMFMRVSKLKEIDFIEKYDWENSPIEPLPEDRVEQIFRNNGMLFVDRRILGVRDDKDDFPKHAIRNLHFLTHASSEKRDEFMRQPVVRLYA